MINFVSGSNQVVGCGSNTSLNDQQPFTIFGWIYPRTMGDGGFGALCTKATGTGGVNGRGRWWFAFGNNTTNDWNFYKQNSTGDLYRYATNNTIVLNTWQSMVGTWDGSVNASGIRMYRNGTEVIYAASQNATALESDATHAFNIGNSGSVTDDFDGFITEVAFWNKVLSPQEIQQISRGRVRGLPLQISPANLKGYWPLDDFSEGITVSGTSTVRDESRNSNHGTPSGSPKASAERVLSCV